MPSGVGTPLSFRGTALTGHIEHCAFPPSEGMVDEAAMFGLTGVSEIVAPIQGRWIVVLMHLGNFATPALLDSYITLLEQTVTENGTLAFGAPLNWSFDDCTLRSVARVDHNGQIGALQNGASDTWTEFVRLTFRRLSP